ncbi:hypothetical protein Hanom_Chr03g00208641 [Helianthus anomalus]
MNLTSRCFKHNTFTLPLRVKINICTIFLSFILWVHFQYLKQARLILDTKIIKE